MKKFVLKLELFEEQDKRRALKTVSTLSVGIDEITIDMKGKKLTVVGTVDPITVVSKLRRKNWSADIISVGPAKEEPKKEEGKKEEGKKEEGKKEDGKNKEEEGGGKKQSDEGSKKETEKANNNVKVMEHLPQFVYGAAPPMMPPAPPMHYRPYYYQQPMNVNPNYYYVKPHSMEENPNACVIS